MKLERELLDEARRLVKEAKKEYARVEKCKKEARSLLTKAKKLVKDKK
jgi:hypothetical protein